MHTQAGIRATVTATLSGGVAVKMQYASVGDEFYLLTGKAGDESDSPPTTRCNGARRLAVFENRSSSIGLRAIPPVFENRTRRGGYSLPQAAYVVYTACGSRHRRVR